MVNHEDIEFLTLDGLTLRGWLYPVNELGPAVILTPGVSPPKDPTPSVQRWPSN